MTCLRWVSIFCWSSVLRIAIEQCHDRGQKYVPTAQFWRKTYTSANVAGNTPFPLARYSLVFNFTCLGLEESRESPDSSFLDRDPTIILSINIFEHQNSGRSSFLVRLYQKRIDGIRHSIIMK